MLVIKKLLAKILGALNYWRTPYEFIVISSVSVPTGTTLRNFGNFTIPHKGIYLIKIVGWYTQNATGTRRMEISKTAGGAGHSWVMNESRSAVNQGQTICQCVFMESINADNTTYYINGWQNSGANLTFEARVQYLRLR